MSKFPISVTFCYSGNIPLQRKETQCVHFQVKFKFKFQMQAEGSYGNKDPLTGQWTGMIKDLRTQKADMAVIDMSITSVRQTAVDFTMPYMNTGAPLPICFLWAGKILL